MGSSSSPTTPDKSVSGENMKIVFLLFAITAVKSATAKNCEASLDLGGGWVVDSYLKLGDMITTGSIPDVENETYRRLGLYVKGCGSWDVFERYNYIGYRGIAYSNVHCIDASDGSLSSPVRLSDIGFKRIRSVRKRNSPCPRRGKRNVQEPNCPKGQIWPRLYQKCFFPFFD